MADTTPGTPGSKPESDELPSVPPEPNADPAVPPPPAADAGAVPPPPPGFTPPPAVPPSAFAAALVEQARALVSPGGLLALAKPVGAVVGVALLSAVLYALAAAGLDDGSGTSASSGGGSGLAQLLVLAGGSLGGGLSLRIDAGDALAAGGATVSVLSLGTLAAVAASTYALVRFGRRSADDPRTPAAVAARAGMEGLVTAAVATALLGFWRSTETLDLGFGSLTTRIAGRPGMTFLVVLVTAGLASGAARRLSPRTRRAAALRFALREAWSLCGAVLAGFGVAALVAAVVAAVRGGHGALALAALPLAGNAAGYAAVLGTFGGVRAGPETAMVWDLWSAGAWVFLLTVLIAAFAAVRLGVRRTRTGAPVWRRTWQVVAVSALVWALLDGLLLTAAAGGGVDSLLSLSGQVRLAPAWWSFLTMLALVAGLSVLAEYAPAFAYTLSPTLLRALGGGAAARRWEQGVNEDDRAVLIGRPGGTSGTSGRVGVPPAPGPASYAATSSPEREGWGAYPGAAGATGGAGGAGQQRAGWGTPPPPRPPMSAATRRRIRITVLVVAVLVLLGGAGAGAIAYANAQRSPATVVSRYLDLLASGQAQQASAMVDPGVPKDQATLLTDAAMRHAKARISVVGVQTTDVSSSQATVEATLSLAGKRFTHEFTVAAGPKDYGLLRTWQLKDPFVVPVSIHSDAFTSLEVAGTDVDVAGDSGGSALYVYPGEYEVAAPSSLRRYLTVKADPIAATSAEGADVTAEAGDTPAFQDAVLAQVRQLVSKCASVPGNMDSACPYEVQATDLASLTVTHQPSGFSDFSLTSFSSECASIRTVENPSEFLPDPDPQDNRFVVQGTIEIGRDGAPTITGVSSYDDFGSDS